MRNTSTGFSPAEASDWLTQCAYLAQQWLPEQHLPPQQSALREVAVAVPIMARVVIIIKRYFIESLLLN
jgi:hypothetical protein